MSAVAARLRGHRDRYAVCPEDGFWFRPVYTGGKCPLCGEEVVGGPPRLPFLVGLDRFWVAMAALVLSAIAMSALVLVLYFR
ncbi:MAG TPA: hypothetical protein VKR79_08040 [Gaiellaceae bacterium]|nr:hypothetical protein [Gaiellaceae bacterium]